MKKVNVDFSYYDPINKQQSEFHTSEAKHKCLLGGYGSGKTYPAIHESLFHCLKNEGHEYLIARNTWESLTENVEKELLQVAEMSNVIRSWDKTHHDLTLINGTVIRFRPLSLKRAQFKGLNICGFFIDDPDISRYKDTISFLYSRLRNSPRAKAVKFQTLITANYEGHNWLWQKYMRGREEGGNDKFAYWICPTESNPTLPEDFISDLASIHSKSWMDRFVYCKMDSYSGLIYDEYNPSVHDKDLSWCEQDKNLIKILAIDTGITDPTVVLKMATNYKKVFVYGEWYHPNIRSNVLGEYLKREKETTDYRAMVIDPSAAKKEQTSGSSVRRDLRREFGINTIPANNAIDYGIELTKSLLTRKDEDSHLYIDPLKCPHTIREMEIYSWAEPEMSEFDELAFKEKPIDKDNHCMDTIRYGICYLKKYIRGIHNGSADVGDRRKKLWEDRFSKLKMYRTMKPAIKDVELQRRINIHYQKNRRYKTQFGK